MKNRRSRNIHTHLLTSECSSKLHRKIALHENLKTRIYILFFKLVVQGHTHVLFPFYLTNLLWLCKTGIKLKGLNPPEEINLC